ncbi:hypothetical protein [Janibacter melonis]|uniref:hypothetical protein n=1 Tax=Janibacter melonis TaxID=262209 RepID=UPI002096316A|nr:hypothetical protein [Janibacter melonis]
MLGDHRGPRALILTGVVTFVVAQVLTGLAPSMPVLLLGRATSGVAEGCSTSVSSCSSPTSCPSTCAPGSSPASPWRGCCPRCSALRRGARRRALGWRAVFVTPLVLLAVALPPLLTALRDALPAPVVGGALETARRSGPRSRRRRRRRPHLGHGSVGDVDLAAPTAAAGAVVLVLAGRRLLPAGTATLSAGIPRRSDCACSSVRPSPRWAPTSRCSSSRSTAPGHGWPGRAWR